MDNKKNNITKIIQVLVLLVLLVLLYSCNSKNIKPDSTEPLSKSEAAVQTSTISYEECDTLRGSLNYRYGYVFEKKDSIQENTTVHYMVRMYYDHFNEINSWEGYGPFYLRVGVTTNYAFPINAMDNSINVFEIDGINNRLTAFGKQVGYEEVLKYNRDDDYKLYCIEPLSSVLVYSNDINNANDVLIMNCSFGYRKQCVRHVFHRSYILDISSKACLSVGEYIGSFNLTNTTGEVAKTGQIYAERGFGGLRYGYIYMDGMNYLGWSTKLQENNPELNSDIFPYDIPNKSWSFGELDSKSHKPISMFKGNEAFAFDYDNNVISHFLNNRLTEFILYDDELDDPRIWNIEHHGAKVVEYEFGNNGGLWRRKYWSRNGKLYMPVTINENEDENSPREVYRAEANSYSDTKVVRIDSKYNYDNNDYVFFILELDEITGLYNRVATIQKESDLKPYILKKYLDW
jgi:hypothetical protein